jgi:hypothetical protein
MTADQESVVRVRPWWLLLWSLASLVVVAASVLVFWYNSTADLAAIREQATRQGVPTSVVEWGRTPSSMEQRARFDRLGVLSKQLKDYDTELATNRIPGDPKRERLRPFLPVPAKAREYHADLDQATVAEALSILDALPDERIVLSDGDPRQRPKDNIGTYRRLIRWLTERVLLAERDQVLIEVRRLLRVLVMMDVQSDVDAIVQASLVAIILPVVAACVDDVRPSAADIIPVLEQVDRRLPEDIRAGQIGSFLELLSLVDPPGNGSNITAWSSQQSWADPYLNPLRIRAGRAFALAHQLERERQARQLGLGREYLLWSEQTNRHMETLRDWHPGEWFPKFIGTGSSMMDEFTMNARLHLRLLIAELRREPWPPDPFDPDDQPLRRLTRDGVVIGAYSFGSNRQDDGGHRTQDKHFLLFGPLDPSRPAAE